ncbi:hypothetical protein ASPZODRAFT_19642 [Penicilliopsis zonata CBS 506.65]|uniref:Myb-like domain-containing protein n=1 Tax=Penicilliopsis zonata CBS 506.65 TaxID=1073090 RepID=A0A1L9S7V2_9EURO|nr:hypothetical protein ASPZODRAFT_19642 [Penicilliopsis zonata CBS 506.65]OJJ43238.1 hypothetical protein ASPZODRAFT_19642 [Penicilliopsis zonata CBS 506.65]
MSNYPLFPNPEDDATNEELDPFGSYGTGSPYPHIENPVSNEQEGLQALQAMHGMQGYQQSQLYVPSMSIANPHPSMFTPLPVGPVPFNDFSRGQPRGTSFHVENPSHSSTMIAGNALVAPFDPLLTPGLMYPASVIGLPHQHQPNNMTDHGSPSVDSHEIGLGSILSESIPAASLDIPNDLTSDIGDNKMMEPIGASSNAAEEVEESSGFQWDVVWEIVLLLLILRKAGFPELSEDQWREIALEMRNPKNWNGVRQHYRQVRVRVIASLNLDEEHAEILPKVPRSRQTSSMVCQNFCFHCDQAKQAAGNEKEVSNKRTRGNKPNDDAANGAAGDTAAKPAPKKGKNARKVPAFPHELQYFSYPNQVSDHGLRGFAPEFVNYRAYPSTWIWSDEALEKEVAERREKFKDLVAKPSNLPLPIRVHRARRKPKRKHPRRPRATIASRK